MIAKELTFFAMGKRRQAVEGPRVRVGFGQGTDQVCSRWQALKCGIGGRARIPLGLRGKGGAGGGHCQQNLDSEITASVTICQVKNKVCELNALRVSSAKRITRKVQKNKCPTLARTNPARMGHPQSSERRGHPPTFAEEVCISSARQCPTWVDVSYPLQTPLFPQWFLTYLPATYGPSQTVCPWRSM